MFNISPYGDRGIRIQFGSTISPETHQLIRSFSVLLEKEQLPGVIEWIPTYTAISLYYDPYVVSYGKLASRIVEMGKELPQMKVPAANVIHIPTCYGDVHGPDLKEVARYNGLDEDEVIAIHSGREYLIYMIGFTPGFPYLGGMSPKIATPRLAVPRAKIPTGSVGIAGGQTGIYSLETPGGWQLIGRTPLKLYDPNREPPVLLRAGHYIKFTPISAKEYKHIEHEVIHGTYKPMIESREDS